MVCSTGDEPHPHDDGSSEGAGAGLPGPAAGCPRTAPRQGAHSSAHSGERCQHNSFLSSDVDPHHWIKNRSEGKIFI